MQTITANGAKIPVLGLGTWQLNGATGSRITEQALRLGYRHLDCALIYGNEREVGEGCEVSRSADRAARRDLGVDAGVQQLA